MSFIHRFPGLRIVLVLPLFLASIYFGAGRMAWGDGAPPASFAGAFSDDKITLQLTETAGAYTGTFTKGDQHFPAKASANGSDLAGTFVAGDHEFAFTATLADGKLLLVTGGKTHSMTRAAANPLNRSNAPVAERPAGNLPFEEGMAFGDFTVLGSTPRGRTLFTRLAAAPTLESAMTQTADELGKVLDAKPVVTGAFANGKLMNKGGVTFTSKLKGQPMQGLILCGIDPKGGSATVILATVDATKDDINALQAAMPAPLLKMTTHKFADGSGSIDLPDGWTTPDQTAAHGIGVEGPAGQVVLFGSNQAIKLPDCMLVKQSDQTYAMQMNTYNIQMQNYRQNVEARKRFPNILALQQPKPPVAPDPDPNVRLPAWQFCRYCDGPEEVLKYWFPIREQIQRRSKRGYTTLDKVFEVIPLPPNPLIPRSKAGVAYVAMTDHNGEKVTHVRAILQMSTAPILEGDSWQLSGCVMRAPEETFEKDLPVMHAIMNSIKLDMNVIGKETQAETDAALAYGKQLNDALLQRGREFQEAQAVRFNNFERQMAAQQQARHDSASDFIEYIGGVRHVYDTRTGKMLDVDLFHSDAITDGLNALANDPHAFVQIPLRYLR